MTSRIAPSLLDRKFGWICLGFGLVSLFVYGRVLFHGFLRIDDLPLIVQQPQISGGLTWSGVVWAFTNNFIFGSTTSADYWAPGAHLSHMLDFEWFGINPAGHHFTNLIIHLTNALLIFLNLRQCSGEKWKSLLVALLFLIHPLQVETVSWVVQRKGLLGVHFGLWAIWSWFQYSKSGRTGYFLLTLVLFQMSLMSKMSFLPLPFCLLFLEGWHLTARSLDVGGKDLVKIPFSPWTRLQGRDRLPPEFGRLTGDGKQGGLWEKVLLLGLAFLNGWIAMHSVSRAGNMESMESISLVARLSNAVISCFAYLEKIFWPFHLSMVYTHPGETFSMAATWFAVAGLLGLTWLAFYFRAKAPWFWVGWSWYLVALIPFLGIFQTEALAMADRFAYLPILGILICVVWSLELLLVSLKKGGISVGRWIDYLIWTSVCMILACTSIRQVAYWKSDWTLLEHIFDVAPDDALAHFKVAGFYVKEGKLEDAERHYREVLRIKPDHGPSFLGLANVHIREGFPNLALEDYQTCLRIQPDSEPAHRNLGHLLIQLGSLEKAVSHYREALKLNEKSVSSRFMLAEALYQLGNLKEAEAQYRAVLEQEASHAGAVQGLKAILDGRAGVNFKKGG